MLTKWDFFYLKLAQDSAKGSKDRTKIGAVIARPDKTLASIGFNGLPKRMDDDKYLADREWKNRCIIHAEMNAILHCKDPSLENYTIYVWGLHPCAKCVGPIVETGIMRCVSVDAIDSPNKEMWLADQEVAEEVFMACGVQNEHYSIMQYFQKKAEYEHTD
jgi:dCMP deaminase